MIQVLARQWLADIAIEASGNLDSLFEMANDNGLGITDDLTIGSMLVTDFDSNIQPNKQVVLFYAQNSIMPATGLTEQDIASQLGGIGYMGLQIDFKVS
ncbi:MAG: hypothetical protein ACRDE2_06315 [Chitinophagaceae bacterium]